MLEDQDKKLIQQMIDASVSKDFSKRVGDTPTDDLQLTPRKYVNMYASVTGLPQASVVGQQVFLTDVGRPVFRRPDGKWVDGAGSVNA